MNTAPQPESDLNRGPGRRIEDDLSAIERDLHRHPRPQPSHDYDVQMNYRQLTLHGQRLTGLQIKEQAITAGIPHIQANFHLTVERAGHDAEHTIGDSEMWTVHDGDCFTAVKPDDNS